MLDHQEMKRRAERRRFLSKFMLVGIILIIAVVVIGGCAAARGSQDTVTFKVTDKTTKVSCDRSHDGDCKDTYLIFTDKGTFKDEDALVFFKFNSSDVYGQLEKGRSYTCKVFGWRMPLFSSYRNIISCKDAV